MDVEDITIEVKSYNIINVYEELKKENEFLKKKLEETKK